MGRHRRLVAPDLKDRRQRQTLTAFLQHILAIVLNSTVQSNQRALSKMLCCGKPHRFSSYGLLFSFSIYFVITF